MSTASEGFVATKQVPSSHYRWSEYHTKARFASYWHQLNAVFASGAREVLEVGGGDGFVSGVLRRYGVDVTTLDIDPDLGPDLVAAADAIPFGRSSFDLVLCCQVLEHMPIETAEAALHEFHRVTRGRVVLSIPDVSPVGRLVLPIPTQGSLEFIFRRWWRRPPKHVSMPEQHHWEGGMRDYPLARIRSAIVRAGFEISSEYRVFENLFHRFFELDCQ